MVILIKPAVERRLYDNISEYGTRRSIADNICGFLRGGKRGAWSYSTIYTRDVFYRDCGTLLEAANSKSERLLLYLPFWVLWGAPGRFRETYKRAWYRLLNVKDVRENFHFGDCFEIDARPKEGLARVVKCAHLTPWLLKYGYISQKEILDILQNNGLDQTLLQSFKDTWGYIKEKGILSESKLRELSRETMFLPKRKLSEPLYNSDKRKKWLESLSEPVELLTPSARLEGPFADNIPAFKTELKEIASKLEPSEIVMVGGSKLKGYGTKDSDLDVWKLKELCASEDLYPGSAEGAHIYLNTIWLGGSRSNLEQTRQQIIDLYFNSPSTFVKRRAIEKLESDLLQYRLLHKGFARFTGRMDYGVPKEMDGDCPFYDDEYRTIATMLYVKYVWL